MLDVFWTMLLHSTMEKRSICFDQYGKFISFTCDDQHVNFSGSLKQCSVSNEALVCRWRRGRTRGRRCLWWRDRFLLSRLAQFASGDHENPLSLNSSMPFNVHHYTHKNVKFQNFFSFHFPDLQFISKTISLHGNNGNLFGNHIVISIYSCTFWTVRHDFFPSFRPLHLIFRMCLIPRKIR